MLGIKNNFLKKSFSPIRFGSSADFNHLDLSTGFLTDFIINYEVKICTKNEILPKNKNLKRVKLQKTLVAEKIILQNLVYCCLPELFRADFGQDPHKSILDGSDK